MIVWVVSKRLLSYAFRYENEIRQSWLEKQKNTVEKCHTFAPPVNGNSRYCPYTLLEKTQFYLHYVETIVVY